MESAAAESPKVVLEEAKDPYLKVHLHGPSQTPLLHDFHDVMWQRFTQLTGFKCTLLYFGEESNRMFVNVELDTDNNRIILSSSTKESGLPFEHAPLVLCMYSELLTCAQCPMKQLQQKNTSTSAPQHRYVRVGVCVLLENEKKEILITRRAKHMRTFPAAWVLPGGHFDVSDPTFAHAGARELFEETGIQLGVEELHMFGVYESVFPVFIEEGPPQRHHIVIYLHGKVHSSSIKLQLELSEVDAAAWIDPSCIAEALSQVPSHNTFTAFSVEKEGCVQQVLSLRNLQSIMDTDGKLPTQRLSTGTRYILREWLSKQQLPL